MANYRSQSHERPHGTYVKYKLEGCRCYRCAAAQSAYYYAWKNALAAGT
jgi:hypothetical protein